MCSLENVEVFVPKDANVKTIHIRSLPAPISRRMGLPPSLNGSDTSQRATWISPVVIREKCPAMDSGTKDTARVILTSQVTKMAQFWLPVISSNLAAFRLLKEFLPAGRTSQSAVQETHEAPLSCGRASHLNQDAIILYHGRIFLSIKNLRPVGRQQGKQMPAFQAQQFIPPAVPSTQQSQKLSPYCKTQPPSPSHDTAHQNKSCPAGDEPQDVRTLLMGFGITCQVKVMLPKVSAEMLVQKWATSQGQIPAPPDELDQREQEGSLGSRFGKVSPDRSSEDGARQSEEGPIDVEMTDPVEMTGTLSPPSPGRGISVVNDKGQCRGEGRGNGHAVDGDEQSADGVHHQGKAAGWTDGEHQNTGKVDGASIGGSEEGTAEIEGTGSPPEQVWSRVKVDVLNDGLIDGAPQMNHDESEDWEGVVDGDARELGSEDEGEELSGFENEGEDDTLPAFFSAPQQDYGFDFEQSAREERISRIRALLREKEAALNTLCPPS